MSGIGPTPMKTQTFLPSRGVRPCDPRSTWLLRSWTFHMSTMRRPGNGQKKLKPGVFLRVILTNIMSERSFETVSRRFFQCFAVGSLLKTMNELV